MKYFKKVKNVYQKEGLKNVGRKILKNARIYVLREASMNRKKIANEWLSLKGKYKGERVFLIGNGPSINKTPLYLLKNEKTMCFNRINVLFERLSWYPSFYICDDEFVAPDCKNDINNEIVPNVGKAFFPDYHKTGLNFKKFIKEKDNVLWFHHDFLDFSYELPTVGTGGTVAFTGLQILLYLGFSEVYIIGMDMDYKLHKTASIIEGVQAISNKDDDPNHFDPRYFGKGKAFIQPDEKVMSHMLESMALANEKYKTTCTKLYNATIGGKVECFDRVDYHRLFDHLTEHEKEQLFLDSFDGKYNNIQELNNEFKLVEDGSGDLQISFSIEFERGLTLISKKIETHIPFGPFQYKYYFMFRNK